MRLILVRDPNSTQENPLEPKRFQEYSRDPKKTQLNPRYLIRTQENLSETERTHKAKEVESHKDNVYSIVLGNINEAFTLVEIDKSH